MPDHKRTLTAVPCQGCGNVVHIIAVTRSGQTVSFYRDQDAPSTKRVAGVAWDLALTSSFQVMPALSGIGWWLSER